MNHPRTSALIEHIRQVGVGLGNAPEEWVDLARELEDELAALRDAVAQTLRENAHLADGENCTLIRLKRALAMPAPSSIQPADARAVIADLIANAVPVAAESGDAGMVFVEMTEAEWQSVVNATDRARAFLAK